MNYFDFDGMRAYAAKSGTTYDASDPAAAWYYDTRDKLYYLIRLISEKLAMPLPVTYKEQPNAQKGRGKIVFKEYVLAGFAPEGFYPDGTLFIKVAFHNLTNQPYLSLEIDINAKAEDNPFEARRDQILQTTRYQIPVDTAFPSTWDELVYAIQPHVEKLIRRYKELADLQNSVEQLVGQLDSKNKKTKKDKTEIMLNTILYGPPGTGKTYHTVDLALEIASISTSNLTRSERKEHFETLRRDGQIVFVTFHQSMGYEEFIEGIKPLPPEEDKPMQYTTEDGIFKQLAIRALYEYQKNKPSVNTTLTKEEAFNLAYEEMRAEFEESLSENKPVSLETKSGYFVLVKDVSDKGNIRLGHEDSPRERPYIVSKSRLFKIFEAYGSVDAIKNVDKDIRAVIGGSNATAFWAVFKCLMTKYDKIPKTVSQETFVELQDYTQIKDAVSNFRLTKELAQKIDAKPYILIIDEINRGNVSQIFGELITLIEEDKRLGKEEALPVKLSYSKESFGIPPNLYIIGTMNTADRSVEALDTALRRRFSFVHMKPDPQKIAPAIVAGTSIDLQSMLKKINERLAVLIDADHTIGHAWLMGVEDLEGLKTVFRNKIIPLLQEFFYQDYEKIGLVLGDGFVEAKTVDSQKLFAALKNGSGLAEEYKDLKEFVIKPEADWDFTSI